MQLCRAQLFFQGDSGGPLNYDLNGGKRYVALGVASFVSSMGCEFPTPQVFTRVSRYLEWIQAITDIETM